MPPTDTAEGKAGYISTHYPAEHRDRIAKIASAQGRSAAAQIRFILAQYLAKHDDTGAPHPTVPPLGVGPGEGIQPC